MSFEPLNDPTYIPSHSTTTFVLWKLYYGICSQNEGIPLPSLPGVSFQYEAHKAPAFVIPLCVCCRSSFPENAAERSGDPSFYLLFTHRIEALLQVSEEENTKLLPLPTLSPDHKVDTQRVDILCKKRQAKNRGYHSQPLAEQSYHS